MVLRDHQRRAAQLAFALAALLGEDVALERLATFVLAGAGGAEALRGGAIGLDLGHVSTPVALLLAWPRSEAALRCSPGVTPQGSSLLLHRPNSKLLGAG